MATYSGKETKVEMPVEQAFAKISNLGALQGLIEQMPEEIRSKMADTTFSDDEIVIGTPQMGKITLKVTERKAPLLLKLEAQQSPVPMAMSIKLRPEGETASAVKSEIDIEIPAMLRPLIGGKLQEAADKFGDVLNLVLKN